MLTITPEARTYALENGGTLFLGYIALTGGCGVPFRPGPTGGFRRPIPYGLPDVPLVVAVAAVLGFKRLVIKDWRHF